MQSLHLFSDDAAFTSNHGLRCIFGMKSHGDDNKNKQERYVVSSLDTDFRTIKRDGSPPLILCDFGHENCQNEAEGVLNDMENSVAYFASQGAATYLNSLFKDDVRKMPVCMIFEGPLLDPEAAIAHQFSTNVYQSKTSFDLSWHTALYYMVKFLFPFYTPYKKKPLYAFEYIDPSVPIILIHATHDNVVPIESTLAFYHALVEYRRSLQEKNISVKIAPVYLLTPPSSKHIGLFHFTINLDGTIASVSSIVREILLELDLIKEKNPKKPRKNLYEHISPSILHPDHTYFKKYWEYLSQ